MYANGIKADQIALTQAGLIKLVKFIIHTTSHSSQVDKYFKKLIPDLLIINTNIIFQESIIIQ